MNKGANASLQSFDIVLRNAKTATMAMLTLTTSCGCGAGASQKLRGTISAFDQSSRVEASIGLPDDLLDRLKVRERTAAGLHEIEFLDLKGKPTGYVFRHNEVASTNAKFQVLAGQFTTPKGDVIDVFAIVDPVPVVVIIAGIAAALCLLIVGIQALTSPCAAAVAACLATGGTPTVTVSTTLGVSFTPAFTLGCSYSCTVACAPAVAPPPPPPPPAGLVPGGTGLAPICRSALTTAFAAGPLALVARTLTRSQVPASAVDTTHVGDVAPAMSAQEAASPVVQRCHW